jgi:hypothetical protein
MLTLCFVSSRWAVAGASLLIPWIDERIVFALPACLIVRFVFFGGIDRAPTRRLLVDSIIILAGSALYTAIRAVALLAGDPLAPNYVASHWDEVQDVPWTAFFEGLLSGYRAAWVMIFAGMYWWWRRAGWVSGLILAGVIAFSAIGALFVAADMSRSTMIVLPSLFLGIALWHESQPRSFKLVLPIVLLANLLLPANHVMWNRRFPIHSLPQVWAESTPSFLDPEIYTREGHVHLAQGNLADAGLAFDTAVKLDDRYAPAYLLRAAQRLRQDNLTGAQADIRDALRLTPDLPDALFLSAVIAQRLNDVSTARTNVQKALQNAPSDWPQRRQAEQLSEQLNGLPDR